MVEQTCTVMVTKPYKYEKPELINGHKWEEGFAETEILELNLEELDFPQMNWQGKRKTAGGWMKK